MTRTMDDAAGARALPPPERPLRIALLGYRSSPHSGGQGIYLASLSRALRNRGHAVDVISGPPYPELDDGIRLIKIPSLDLFAAPNHVTALRWKHFRSAPDLFEYFSMLTGGFPEPFTFGQRLKAHFLAQGNPYDVVHDNQTLAPGVLALQRWGVPLVTTIHHPIQRDLALALDQQRDWKGRLLVRRWHHFLRMQERVVPQLKHLVTVSAASRDAIAEAFRIPTTRIKVVHNGVDGTRWAPLPEVTRAPNTLLTVASADQPLKGLTVLLEALATLRKSHPALTLRVIGKLNPDGPTGARLQALGLGEAVTFEAGLSEAMLRQRYAQATLAVVPSLYEGFGFPAAEAMACGTPLVSSTGGALGEVVGDAGLTVPPGDSDALAKAIDQLLKAPELRLGLGARGRSRALEQFSWARAGAAMVQRYQEARSP